MAEEDTDPIDNRKFESPCPICKELRPCGYCQDCDPDHFEHLAYHGDGWNFERVEFVVPGAELRGALLGYHFMIPKPLYDYIKTLQNK